MRFCTGLIGVSGRATSTRVPGRWWVAGSSRWPYSGRTGRSHVDDTYTQRAARGAHDQGRALAHRSRGGRAGTDLTEFVVSNLTVAARRVLADRSEFVLDAEAVEAWEAVNRRRSRDLPGLGRLMERPSPFTTE